MQIGVFQLLSARREALDVELAELETLREYWTAVAALQALLTGVQVDGSAATGAVGSVDATNDAGGD
jgi:outer membrane protein TolC